MRKVVVVSVLALALTGVPGAVASDAVNGPPGTPCVAVPDPTGGAELSGGPYAGDGTLTCSVVSGSQHDDTVLASASASGTEVVTLAPTPVAATGTVCTRFEVTNGPTLYWDGDGTHWTVNADSYCAAQIVVCIHTRCAANDLPEEPPKPFYPRATVEISVTPTGQPQYLFTEFDPPQWRWNGCTPGPDFTVTPCDPPPAPAGYYNVCGTATVTVTNQSPFEVRGTSKCHYGATAEASARYPFQPATADAAAPNADFAWTCAADPATLALLWKVRCTVGQ